MPRGLTPFGSTIWVILPLARRPILLAAASVNQIAPSEPVAMPIGLLLAVGIRIPPIRPAFVM